MRVSNRSRLSSRLQLQLQRVKYKVVNIYNLVFIYNIQVSLTISCGQHLAASQIIRHMVRAPFQWLCAPRRTFCIIIVVIAAATALHTTSQASDGWFTPPTTKATVPFTTSHQADSMTESAKYEVGIFGRTTHAWDAKGDPTRTAIVILVTNEVYLQQLNHSIHLLQANWIQHFPVKKVVIFYTDEVCVSALRIVMTVLHSTKVVLEHVKHDDPDFLSNFPANHCRCCCNNRTQAKTENGAIGGEYNKSYCWMNRFRTLIMYQLHVLRDVDYFVQVDTDLTVEKILPYDPVAKLASAGAVFGHKLLKVRSTDCAEGMHESIDRYFERNAIHPLYSPVFGTQYTGNFNIGDLRFFRSQNFYSFAQFINDEEVGVYSHRWADQAFIPRILGAYFPASRIMVFSDLH